ncbi:hypothetical protein [Gottschalkia acidurici]|uniref:hypothetical protein n=1 Tax=Clostridium acidurici TaxID=1556 RepID=UPI0002D8C882|nr:hypothetical protein [Gottschalkia acidurici]
MGNNKVDRGFEPIYWRLTYRRKFIRTLWLTPINIVVLLLVWNSDNSTSVKTITTIILILLNLTQLIYNYMKWKKVINDDNKND